MTLFTHIKCHTKRSNLTSQSTEQYSASEKSNLNRKEYNGRMNRVWENNRTYKRLVLTVYNESMLVRDLIQILESLNQDMIVVWYDLRDLFVAKELQKEDLRVWYYMDHYSEQKVWRTKKKLPRKIFVCGIDKDISKHKDLDPKKHLFIW